MEKLFELVYYYRKYLNFEVPNYISKIWNSRVFDFVKLTSIYGLLLGCVWLIFGITLIRWVAIPLVLPMVLFVTLLIVSLTLLCVIDLFFIILTFLFFIVYTLFAYTEYTIFKKYRVFTKKDYMLFWISEDKSV